MKLEILGPGCPKCRTLAEAVERVAEKLGLDCEVVKVTEIDRIVEYGVMATPALVVDGTVQFFGRVPGEKELTELLSRCAGK